MIFPSRSVFPVKLPVTCGQCDLTHSNSHRCSHSALLGVNQTGSSKWRAARLGQLHAWVLPVARLGTYSQMMLTGQAYKYIHHGWQCKSWRDTWSCAISKWSPCAPHTVSHATRQQAPKNALVLTHLGGFHSWTLGLRLSWGSPLGPDRVSPILSCHFMFSPTLVPLSSSGLEEMGL